MAASLSRPDPSSPASVAEAAFNTARRGYQSDEVRAFLVAVAAEMGRLQEKERQLEAELRAAREVDQPAELDDETVASLLGEETLRVLHTARESASQIKIRAEDTAARILREANDEANRVRQEADVEAARRRQDAASDAEAEVALAKQQGREMVNEARAYRERVLADLERRTTLARHQIEELIHGRDRLLQVFERARLVAVDVTSELKAIDSPDELVNLSPTTGPVPIMVPNQRRARSGATEGDSSPDSDDQADALGATPDSGDADTRTDAGVADVDQLDVDEVAGDTESAAAADGDLIDETDEVETVETVDPDASDASVQATRADTNVVSLFRGRPTATDAAAADEHPSTDSTQTDATQTDAEPGSADRPDVGGIFERLRQDAPGTDISDHGDATATPDEPAPIEAVEVEAVEGDPVEGDPVEAEPSAFTRRDEALVPLIVAAARRLKRVLADEQNEALDTLRQREPITEIDALVPTEDQHVGAYLAALDEELSSACAAGAAELGLNDTKTLRKKLVKAGSLSVAEARVRTALVSPLRSRLERAIVDGDGDNDEITKRVRAVYREWKTQHIDDQLDDVFRSAYSGGLHAALAPETQIVWVTDPRLTPCPDCEDNSLAGAVGTGTEFPTGHAGAPAHPGCTCLALPVD